MRWTGDYGFLLSCLVIKDFKIRYRGMSLGVFWSLLNPLVMMGILTLVFHKLFPNPSIPRFAVYVLCGIVPYNFFTQAMLTGATSLTDNAGLMRRVPVPRTVFPVAGVLSVLTHFVIQIVLMVSVVLILGIAPNPMWSWLIVVWLLLIALMCGVSLMTSALNLFIRDTRYLIESANLIFFWLTPIFYDDRIVAEGFQTLYNLSPITIVVKMHRQILLGASAPTWKQLWVLGVEAAILVIAGWVLFKRMEKDFYNRL